MTKEAIEAASTETYSVAKYKRGGKFICWYTRIGYNEGKPGGERVRAWQYHGKDFPSAQKAALDLAAQWEAIYEEYKRLLRIHNYWVRTCMAKVMDEGFYLDDNEKKVELDFHETLMYDAALEEYRQRLERKAPRLPVWPPKGEKTKAVTPAVPIPSKAANPNTITIAKAKEKFLAIYKARVGLQGPRGIKERSYVSMGKSINAVIRAIDDTLPITSLDRQAVQGIVNYWLHSDRGLSERTAANYLRSVRQFVEEVARMDVGYTKPDIADLFVFRAVKGEIAKYNPKAIRTLLNAVDERCKLYQMLALNCGMQQVDICAMKLDEIVTIRGEMFIARKREKTSHQNDFVSMWWLFPETAALLKKYQARKNPKGLALLRPSGDPMIQKGSSRDYVSLQWDRVRGAAPAVAESFSFKQYRKVGISAIKRITGIPDVARQYAAHKIEGALAHYDRDDFFEPLTAALRKWHAELKKDQVF